MTTNSTEVTNDGRCSLPEAIIAANNDRPAVLDGEFRAIGECPAGNGVDLIDLPPGYFTFSVPYNSRDGIALPAIRSSMVIMGKGKAYLKRVGGIEIPLFRFLQVAKDGDLTVRGINFFDGSVDKGGGAIRNYGSLTVQDSFFGGNEAASGGAIHNAGRMTVERSVFSRNGSHGILDFGGAILSTMDASTVIAGSDFRSNTATFGGGVSNLGDMEIRDSSFSWNNARVGGGAIASWDKASLTNTTITSNWAGEDGGAIAFYPPLSEFLPFTSTGEIGSADMKLESCSIVGNVGRIKGSKGSGGAIVVPDKARVTLHNTILAENIDLSDGKESNCIGSLISDGYNLIGQGDGCGFTSGTGDQVGTAERPLNPRLGPSETVKGTQVLPILADSPALDLGDPSRCPSADQSGTLRPQGKGCDIGAAELDVSLSY